VSRGPRQSQAGESNDRMQADRSGGQNGHRRPSLVVTRRSLYPRRGDPTRGRCRRSRCWAAMW